jgi:Family of unknown function (DUF6526)
MSKFEQQSLKNHARFDPAYHFLIFGAFLANVIYACIHLYRHPGVWSGWYLLLSVAVIVPVLKLRQYPLKLQDRIIRLEERLRLQALAPTEWHTQIYRLSEDQLIALRFAGDDEVVGLAKQALEEKLNRKQIKERIRSWRADNWRI